MTSVPSSAVNLDSYYGTHNLKQQQQQKQCLTIVNNFKVKKSVDISFENLSFSVDVGFRKETKKILHKINGTFRSGQLIAIIGPSGAGKTTLLELLCGKNRRGFSGKILTNKLPQDLEQFQSSSCYIPCKNHLQPLLTVWENMAFVVDLKFKNCFSEEKKNIMIRNILNSLVLEPCVDVRAGHLSGGQQKRLSIALELIKNPLVMFLDEPTTGLDSFSSTQCIRLLQKLAGQGKTIVCSVHQPPASMFQRFDQVYALASGKCVYQGTPKNLVPFLEYVNYPCPKYYNPVDYIVELVSTSSSQEEISIMVEMTKNGESSKWLEGPLFLSKSQVGYEPAERNAEEVSTFDQFKVLLKRSLLKSKRDWALTNLRLGVNLLTGLICGFVYWQIGYRGDKMRHNYNFLYCVLMHHMMTTMMLTILSSYQEMLILKKEHFNGWYSLKAHFAASTVADLPISIICCLLFTIIAYPMTNQPMEFERVFNFTTISIMIVVVAQSYGLLIGSSFNLGNATFVGPSLSVPIMLLANYSEELHPIINTLTYTSYMKFGHNGIVDAIYGSDREPLYCPDDKFCYYKYPQKFLKDRCLVNIDKFWFNLLGLCLFYAIFRLFTYLVIKIKVKRA